MFLLQVLWRSNLLRVLFSSDQRACFMDFSTHWDVFWTVTYSVIAIVITVSNSATIVIFVKRNFWSVFVSWFKAWPLWAHFWELNQFSIHPQEALLLLVFQCVDVVTLASILLERMYAILWSLRHRTRRYLSTLAWLESRGYLVCWEFRIDFFFTSSLYPGWAS